MNSLKLEKLVTPKFKGGENTIADRFKSEEINSPRKETKINKLGTENLNNQL